MVFSLCFRRAGISSHGSGAKIFLYDETGFFRKFDLVIDDLRATRPHNEACWLTGWWAGWLTGWLDDWLTGLPAGLLSDWLAGWLTGLLACVLADWFTGLLTGLLAC